MSMHLPDLDSQIRPSVEIGLERMMLEEPLRFNHRVETHAVLKSLLKAEGPYEAFFQQLAISGGRMNISGNNEDSVRLHFVQDSGDKSLICLSVSAYDASGKALPKDRSRDPKEYGFWGPYTVEHFFDRYNHFSKYQRLAHPLKKKKKDC